MYSVHFLHSCVHMVLRQRHMLTAACRSRLTERRRRTLVRSQCSCASPGIVLNASRNLDQARAVGMSTCRAPTGFMLSTLSVTKYLALVGKNYFGSFSMLMSVLAIWHAAVVVGLSHEESEPIEWKELHFGPREASTVSTCRRC